MKVLFTAQRGNTFPSSVAVEGATERLFRAAFDIEKCEFDFRSHEVPHSNSLGCRFDEHALALLRQAENLRCTHVYLPATYAALQHYARVRNAHDVNVGILSIPMALRFQSSKFLAFGIMARTGDLILCPSPLVVSYAAVLGLPHALVPHAIEPHIELSRCCAGVGVSISYCGKLVPDKRIERIIEVISELSTRGTVARAVIAGPRGGRERDQRGRYLSYLEMLAERLGVRERIHFPGILYGEVKLRLIKHSSAYMCPSDDGWPFGESFGYGILEALACGTPVVVSCSGNHANLLGNGGGWVCDMSRGVGFVAEIIATLASPEVKSRVSEDALKAAALYSVPNVAMALRNAVEAGGTICKRDDSLNSEIEEIERGLAYVCGDFDDSSRNDRIAMKIASLMDIYP